MDFLDWLIVGVIVIVGAVIMQSMVQSRKRREMVEHLDAIGFPMTQQLMGCDGRSGIAIDDQLRQFCLLTYNGSGISERVLPYGALMSAELFEDGHSVTKTSRSSQLGGALVGGIALGGVGAIIGGLSGKTSTSGKISRVDLRITINDIAAPLHDVVLMNVEGNKNGLIHGAAMQQARHWVGILEVAMKQADGEKTQLNAAAASAYSLASSSVADELRKLADLHVAGVLTHDEFTTQKIKLLSQQ